MSFAGLGTASASCGDGRSHDHYVYTPIDCRHCGGHFASVSMLRSHSENAHGLVIGLPATRGTHTCPVCGKTSVELRYLRQHMEKHGEERFVCEKCGQRSRWASTMVRHGKKCTFKPPNALQ